MKKLFLLGALASILFAQTAQYPGAVASDSHLKVAGNFIATTLSRTVAAGDTLLTVRNAANITANMLLTIDTEVVSVTSVSGNDLTVQRGFDGSTAATHAGGARVFSVPTAWDKNALKKEVQAIQTALGVGLANVPSNAVTGYHNSQTYNFAAQTPGGSLTGAINNVVTMSPCPLGVAGANTNHYLYVSGGVGTAEAVLITGGTCTSGASSGNLTFTPANSHSGAWTIASATDGIQEALWAIGSSGATVMIPGGTHTLQAAVTISQEGARVSCTTRNNVVAMVQRTSGVLFEVTAGSVEINGCALRGGAAGGVAAPSGNIGIRASGSSSVRGHFHDLMLDYLYEGIVTTGGFHHKLTNLWGRNISYAMIRHAGGVSPFIDTVTYATDAPYEVPEAGIMINASGAYIYNTDILAARHGILVEPNGADVEWTFIYDARIDQAFHSGVTVRNNSAYEVRGVFIHDLWSASAGVGFAEDLTYDGDPPGDNDGFGLLLEGGGAGDIRQVVVDGGQIHNNRHQNVKILKGIDVKLFNVRLLETNIGDGDDIDNVYITSTGKVEIAECEIRDAGGSVPLRSGVLAGPSNVNITLWNNTFDGTFSAGSSVHDLSLNTGVKVYGFNRGMDDTAQELASAGTMNLPARQYFSVTGSSNIATLQPTYQGRKVYLHNGGVGTWQMNTTGNIQNPAGSPGTFLTVSPGENVICEYSGLSTAGRWLCHK